MDLNDILRSLLKPNNGMSGGGWGGRAVRGPVLTADRQSRVPGHNQIFGAALPRRPRSSALVTFVKLGRCNALASQTANVGR